MKSPRFWYQPAGLWARMLSPLGMCYAAATRWRMRQRQQEVEEIFVICVGNLVVGGSGKTPVALSLAQYVQNLGKSVHFLTRGYRGRLPGPIRVDLSRHDAVQVGDEALLLAQVAPTWVAQDRVAGAQKAATEKVQVLIMDDGFQNPFLYKNLNLLVVDGEVGWGNGYAIPAGPLREKVQQGIARSDGVVLIGPDRYGITEDIPKRIPILRANLKPKPPSPLPNESVLAFAGIGRPQKFFETCKKVGLKVVEQIAFPDHYFFKEKDLVRLAAFNIPLITTAKDAARLPSHWKEKVYILNVTLYWEENILIRFLNSRLP